MIVDEEHVDMRQEAADRVRELMRANGGTITPEEVVEDARDPDSPLHGYFEWDESKAARQAWTMTARVIIRSVRYDVVTEETVFRNVPELVRDVRVPSGTQGYVATSVVRSDEELARLTLLQEFGRAAAALERARKFADVFRLHDELEAFVEQLHLLRGHLDRPQPPRPDA
jgi:hypothetical protein